MPRVPLLADLVLAVSASGAAAQQCNFPATAAEPPDTSGPPAFVGSASRKVFMRAECSLAPQLDALDRVVFRSEAEAKAAGYGRSGAPGC